ncbi:MAG: transposase [Thermoanaerobaculaceae bacterium]|nr:transposase [Thermoanaerobaculaceae bacterium]NLH12013.1 hypothetical protein [Holophagae bacterium]
MRLVIADAHPGLTAAIAAVFTGSLWQRCRTHLTTNVLTKVPKAAPPGVAVLVRMIFLQPDAGAVHQQAEHVLTALEPRRPEAAKVVADAFEDVLAFTAFPHERWRQIWSNNPLQRLTKEIRRRTDVVDIFPNRVAIIRLVGALRTEQHDEWAIGQRYFSREPVAQLNPELKPAPEGRLSSYPRPETRLVRQPSPSCSYTT